MKNLKDWTGERLETFVFNETMVEHLHRYSITMSITKNKKVLDIACGEGYGSNLLAKCANHVLGVDIDSSVIKDAKQKYRRDNLTFIQGQADKIPAADKSIDVVVSFETIEHHDKHEEMMQEIKRVLKSGGILIMSSPEKKTEKSVNPYHIKELTQSEFKCLIQKYFNYNKFFNQKIVMGSIIVPEHVSSRSFETHSGDFNDIRNCEGLEQSVFNICIASDNPTDDFGTSFFDGQEILTNHIVMPYKNSRIYSLIKSIKDYFK